MQKVAQDSALTRLHDDKRQLEARLQDMLEKYMEAQDEIQVLTSELVSNVSEKQACQRELEESQVALDTALEDLQTEKRAAAEKMAELEEEVQYLRANKAIFKR